MNQDIQIDLSNLPTPNLDPRKGIPIESIIALRRKQLSMSQIAKILGCSKPNIVMRLKKIGCELDRLDNFKEVKADLLELELKRNIESITHTDRKKAGYRDKVISAGILIDKIQLLAGKATQIMGYADALKARDVVKMTLEELQAIYKQRQSDAAIDISPALDTQG